MNLSSKDYEIAQNILDGLANLDPESFSKISVSGEDLTRVRGLIKQKLSDFKRTIEGAEHQTSSLTKEGYLINVRRIHLI